MAFTLQALAGKPGGVNEQSRTSLDDPTEHRMCVFQSNRQVSLRAQLVTCSCCHSEALRVTQ